MFQTAAGQQAGKTGVRLFPRRLPAARHASFPVKYALFVMLSFMLSSCGGWAGQSRISSEIERQISQTNGQTVNLSEVGGPEWERVCIFGPYSNNAMARKALGFAWDLETNTSISLSDSINVFVFVKGSSVAAYTEHSRRLGDFWRLSGRCFNRDRSVLVKSEDSFVEAP